MLHPGQSKTESIRYVFIIDDKQVIRITTPISIILNVSLKSVILYKERILPRDLSGKPIAYGRRSSRIELQEAYLCDEWVVLFLLSLS
jgi:hypothetical protein